MSDAFLPNSRGYRSRGEPQEHKLKSWPAYFEPVLAGDKTFEVRRDDRDFQVGDRVVLQEWDPLSEDYTGRELHVDITYVFGCDDRVPVKGAAEDDFPIARGYCVFGFRMLIPVDIERPGLGNGSMEVEGAPA